MINENGLKIKLGYVPGLRDVVSDEIKNKTDFEICGNNKNSIYINYVDDFEKIKTLKTVARVCLVNADTKYNPSYISKHKSALGELVKIVLDKNNKGDFKTFKINCAGSDSVEVSQIKEYIINEFKLVESEEADLKIHITKTENIWEIGVQITPRPFSLREYKVRNMSGAMDSTIAYSLNYLCNLENYKTYLNVFSGSATLMIEAGLNYKNLEKIIGFDNNKKNLSLSIQNIKKAGLIKKIEIKESNIFDEPELGKFDVITSDLPFGMVMSKEEDLEYLYKKFIDYCEKTLNPNGKLGVYTSEFKIFEGLINGSKFKLEKEIKIDLITNEEQYLPVKIFIFRKK